MTDKHERGKNKPKRFENGLGWRRLTRIANIELCTNRDIAPLTNTFRSLVILLQVCTCMAGA